MHKKILTFLLSVSLFFSSVSYAFAFNDPLSVPNNSFGIHIQNENDLVNAVPLVNSGGGDWGYVTFVITESERDQNRWQRVFDQMRRSHIIPIVRIATKADGDTWEKPDVLDIANWVSFLNSLNWVVQNRYIIIGNEPNHAQEWGGKVDPTGYANYLKEFSQKLKAGSPDFFVLPAGLDSSAKNTNMTMEESLFIRQLVGFTPDIFSFIDGWTSHSYPNGHGIDTFQWELTYLQSLGVTKNLPVFITETGWSNSENSEDQIGANLVNSFQNDWRDKKIVAITPFILNYPQAPYLQFSWQKPDGSFYKFYRVVQTLPKARGEPVQTESGQIIGALAQPLIIPGSDYFGAILAKNTGESIWSPNSNTVKADGSNALFSVYSFNEIEPMRLGLIIYKTVSPKNTGVFSQSLFLTGSHGQRITNSFPVEAFLTSVTQMQIQGFFVKILSYFHF